MSLKSNEFINTFEERLEELFGELITQQQKKVLDLARERLPHLTADDILNPDDFPALMSDPIFNYEEGLATGIMAAHVAIRARLLRPLQEELNPEQELKEQPKRPKT